MAAIAAAALKRFLAHMTQLLMEVPISTRKVAMCALHVFGDLVEALKRGDVVGCIPPWRRPLRIWHAMPNALIPNEIDRRDARSWVSNPALKMMTQSSLRRQLGLSSEDIRDVIKDFVV